MSRVRISNKPGGWLDEGWSSVRQSTHIGGEMVVGAPTPGAKNDHWRDRQPVKGDEIRCEATMIRGGICDRLHGHLGYHASREAMDRKSGRREKKPQSLICGAPMMGGHTCGRIRGHNRHTRTAGHKSRVAMDRENKRKRDMMSVAA